MRFDKEHGWTLNTEQCYPPDRISWCAHTRASATQTLYTHAPCIRRVHYFPSLRFYWVAPNDLPSCHSISAKSKWKIMWTECILEPTTAAANDPYLRSCCMRADGVQRGEVAVTMLPIDKKHPRVLRQQQQQQINVAFYCAKVSVKNRISFCGNCNKLNVFFLLCVIASGWSVLCQFILWGVGGVYRLTQLTFTSSSHSFAIYNCVAYNIGMWIQHNFRFHSIYCLALPNEWWMYRLPPGRWFIWMLNDDSVEWATWVPRLTISTLTLYYSSRLWSKLSFGTVTSIYLFYWYKYYYVAPWRVSLVWPRSMWSAHIGSKCTEHI